MKIVYDVLVTVQKASSDAELLENSEAVPGREEVTFPLRWGTFVGEYNDDGVL